MGLHGICAMYDELPHPDTVNLWRLKHEIFSGKYTQAKAAQAELLAEECLDISDNKSNDIKYDKDGNETCNTEFIARSRLRVDTRKWFASKLAPKIYGDQKTLDDLTQKNAEARAEIIALQAKLLEQHKKEY